MVHKKGQEESSTGAPPPTTPGETAYRGSDYRFEYQALFDIQKSMGELKASFDALRISVESIRSKVDDLVNWKHKIIGGAFVLGMIITLCGFAIGRFWDYVTVKAPSAQTQQSTQQPTNPRLKNP